ncbi:uncharacterized protein LOC142551303 isoform X3 [Primulina tabacum]
MSDNLPSLMFWHKLLIQDVEHQNSHKTGCNLSNSFHNLHMIMEEFFRLAHKNTCKPANCVYILYKSKMHVYRTMKMHASCMLANFGRQPSPRVLEQVSDPRFGTSKLVQDGLQFFQFIPCSSYDDDGWIRPAADYEVLVNSEVDFSDFQLANTRQPSPRVLSQVADARCGTSKLVQDGLQFFHFILRSSYDDNGRIHSAEESEVPVKNEMYYSDFQLANIRQPAPPVLAQFVTQDVECRNSRKMGCILPIHRTLFIWKHFPVISFDIQMDIVINGCGPVLRLRITIEGWFPWVSVKLEGDEGWIHPDEDSDFLVNDEVEYSDIQLASIRQPSPPPVLAKISDPRHGTSELPQDGLHFANSYHDLHISVRLMEDFLRLAVQNTAMNLETCGVLAGSLRNRVFQVTTLIIPKQESTSYSCQTLNEEEIFEVQDNNSLFSLGWIHTHPSQTCFMSSVDLHTHFSYQVMLREAIAIVMAPTDKSSPHGIFHLSDPAGVRLIRNCEERGFHPHYEPEDGSPIYERCSHVYIDPCLKHDVIDLR